MKKNVLRFVFLFLVLVVSSGCGQKIVDTLSFKAFPNLETVELRLDFAPQWKVGFGGAYMLPLPEKPYGQLSVEPSSAKSPFRVRFSLDLNIVNDPEYNDKVRYKPVTALPTGYPLPTFPGRAMAMVKGVSPVDKNIDVYTYIDVLGKEWVGVALVFPTLNLSIIPPNLLLFQDFLNAMASVTAFGPAINANGKKVGSPGIAIFANVQELLRQGRTTGKTSAQSTEVHRFIF